MTAKLRTLGIFSVVAALAVVAQADSGAGVIPDVVYGHKDGMALTFDVFKPAGEPNGAGILLMESGGWVSRWWPPELTKRYLEPLLEKGFTAFAAAETVCSKRHHSSRNPFRNTIRQGLHII